MQGHRRRQATKRCTASPLCPKGYGGIIRPDCVALRTRRGQPVVYGIGTSRTVYQDIPDNLGYE